MMAVMVEAVKIKGDCGNGDGGEDKDDCRDGGSIVEIVEEQCTGKGGKKEGRRRDDGEGRRGEGGERRRGEGEGKKREEYEGRKREEYEGREGRGKKRRRGQRKKGREEEGKNSGEGKKREEEDGRRREEGEGRTGEEQEGRSREAGEGRRPPTRHSNPLRHFCFGPLSLLLRIFISPLLFPPRLFHLVLVLALDNFISWALFFPASPLPRPVPPCSLPRRRCRC